MSGNPIPVDSNVWEAADGTYYEYVPELNIKVPVENPELKNHVYHVDIDNQVVGRNLIPQDVKVFPTITVALGPESTEYQPSGFRWNFLTMYFRAYVRSEDAAEELLEELIQDIKTFIDRNETIAYNDIKPDGSEELLSATQMTVQEVTTDEGVLRPHGIGEVRVLIRYQDHNALVAR